MAVVSGDWNADGKVDLAVADSASNRVSVLLGDGSTTFSQTVDFTVGVSPIALIAADLNLDGTTDLAVLNAGSRTVTLLAGNATTFTTARTISIGGAGTPIALAVGTWDGDAIPDLAIAFAGSTAIETFHGDGNYGFVSDSLISGPADLSFLAAFDLDGNSRTDLVAGSRNSGRGFVYMKGTAALGAARQVVVGDGPAAAAFGDFNSDARADIVIANRVSNDVTLLLQTATGNFSSVTLLKVGTEPSAIVAADLNLDGARDVATANFGSSDITVALGDARGGFSTRAAIAGRASTQTLSAVDINGDPGLDLWPFDARRFGAPHARASWLSARAQEADAATQ